RRARICTRSQERRKMKKFIIATPAALGTTALAQEFRAPIGPQKTGRAMATPPPLFQRPGGQGGPPPPVCPGPDPVQMINPLAPAKYGSAEQSVVIDPETGKWKGIKLFEIIF